MNMNMFFLSFILYQHTSYAQFNTSTIVVFVFAFVLQAYMAQT